MTIKADDPRYWDVRTLERRLRSGELSKKDYEKFLKTLPDVSEKVAPAEPDSVDDDEDDEPDDLDIGSNGVGHE